jgi:hypothetical protein
MYSKVAEFHQLHNRRFFFMGRAAGPLCAKQVAGIEPLLRSPMTLFGVASTPTERDKTNGPRQSTGGKPSSAKTPVAPSIFMGSTSFTFRQSRFDCPADGKKARLRRLQRLHLKCKP